MAIYIIISLTSLALAPICGHYFKWGKNKRFYGGDFYLVIMALICLLCMGLRDPSVGYDTAMYARTFTRIGNYPDIFTALSRESNSIPVYVLLCRAIFIINPDPQFHIFIEAIIINSGLFLFIKKASTNYSLSTFLYFGLTLFYFAMNGARQTIAMVLCANAIIILAEDVKQIKGWILFIFATGIHVTTLISAGLIAGIIVYNRKINKTFVTGVFSVAGALGGSILLVVSSVFSGIFTHYEIYFNGHASYSLRAAEGGGRIIVIYLYLSLFVVIWLLKKQQNGNTKYDELFLRLVPGMAFGMALGIFNSKNILINRMVWYYMIFFIPFVPFVIDRCSKRYRWILTIGTVGAFFAYSILFLRENQGAVVPYQFFWK